MKFFIKEIKALTRRNALDEPLYESKYVICRTRVWGRLARLLPSFFTEEMKYDIARISKDLHRDICFKVTWLYLVVAALVFIAVFWLKTFWACCKVTQTIFILKSDWKESKSEMERIVREATLAILDKIPRATKHLNKKSYETNKLQSCSRTHEHAQRTRVRHRAGTESPAHAACAIAPCHPERPHEPRYHLYIEG